MRRRVYLETTVISYLTAPRPSRTVIVAAHQEITVQWWQRRRQDFDLFVSELVLREASAGDPEVAQRRLAALTELPRLVLTEEALQLGSEFVRTRILPGKATEDGMHIALATVHRVDYLLTWNCAHIANPDIQERLAEFLADRGLVLPYICTPEELLGGDA